MSHQKEIPTIIYRVEPRGDQTDYFIAEANQAALDLFHTTREAFIGRNTHDFIEDFEFRQLARLRGNLLNHRESIDQLPVVRYIFKRDDGTWFSADVQTGRRLVSILSHPREEEEED